MSSDTWEYEKVSDRLLGESPAAYPDRVSDLSQIPEGAVFLRKGQQRVGIWWRGEVAVLGHCDSDEQDLECAVTESSLARSESISPSDLVDWTCSCCGVSLGRFSRSLHIRRDVAFDIFRGVIAGNRRPDSSIDGAIVWMEVDAE